MCSKVLKEYIDRTRYLRTNDYLMISCVKPYQHVSKTTLGHWVKSVLKLPGVDIFLFKPHSTRSASTSAAFRSDASIDVILTSAGWANDSMFRKYYKNLFPRNHLMTFIVLRY